MSKHSAATTATRKALVDAFCSIFATKPIERITIQEITNKAGYNRGTFYQYFKDIYALLAYVEDMVLEHIQTKIASNIIRNDVGDALFTSLMGLQNDMLMYMRALLGNPHHTTITDRLKESLLPFYAEQLGVSTDDVRVRYALDFYLSGMTAVAYRWFDEGQKVSPEQMALMVHSLLTQGVLATIGVATEQA